MTSTGGFFKFKGLGYVVLVVIGLVVWFIFKTPIQLWATTPASRVDVFLMCLYAVVFGVWLIEKENARRFFVLQKQIEKLGDMIIQPHKERW